MSTHDQSSSSDDTPADRPETVRIDPPETLWFDRYDRGAFSFLLVLLPLLAMVGLVVGPLLDWANGRQMVASDTGLIDFPGATIEQLSGFQYDEVSATIYVVHPTTGQRLIGLILPVLIVAALTLGAWLLFRITRDIARGYAFSHANVGRLRWLSVIVGVMTLILTVGPSIVAAFLLPTTPELDEYQTGFDFAPMVLGVIAAMVLAMLSQAFLVGTQLTDDVSDVI